MSLKPGAYLGGIRTLNDIKLRCYVPSANGCWHWRMRIYRGRSCCVWLLGGTEYKSTASRAAWILSGRPMEPGWVVTRNRDVCDSVDCCRPEHHLAGPRTAVFQGHTPEQRTRHRIGTTIEARRRAKLNMEAAKQIRLSDAPCRVEAEKWGVAVTTISQIRRGETWRENTLA